MMRGEKMEREGSRDSQVCNSEYTINRVCHNAKSPRAEYDLKIQITPNCIVTAKSGSFLYARNDSSERPDFCEIARID